MTREPAVTGMTEIKKLTDIISTDLIEPHLSGETRDDIIDEMIEKLSRKGMLLSDTAAPHRARGISPYLSSVH